MHGDSMLRRNSTVEFSAKSPLLTLLLFALLFFSRSPLAPPKALGQQQPPKKAQESPPHHTLQDVHGGVYCLYTCLLALDFALPEYPDFEKSLGPVPEGGFSLAALAAAAERYGAHTLQVSTSIANLRKRDQRLACIAVYYNNHFVNVMGVDERNVRIIDPSSRYPSVEPMPHDSWRALWDGTGLLISKEPLVPEEDLPRDVPWTKIAMYVGLVLAVLLILLFARGANKKSNARALLLLFSSGGVGLSALALTGCGGSKGGAAADSPGPHLHLKENKLDLGGIVAFWYKPHVVTFEVSNQGDEPLVIKEIQSSYEQMSLEVPDGQIPPGESKTLKITLKMRSREKVSQATATLVSNDTAHPRTSLRITWQVIEPIKSNYLIVDFGHVLRGSAPQKRELKLIAGDGQEQPVAIKGVTATPPEILTVRLVGEFSEVAASSEPLLELEFNPVGALGNVVGGVIKVQFESEQQPELLIPVKWFLHAAVEAAPEILSLGTAKPAEEKIGTILLSAFDTLPLGKVTVTLPEDDPFHIKFEIKPINETAASIEITGTAPAELGVANTKLKIVCEGEGRDVEVPITCLVR